jgi:hypothetical protein
VRTGRAWGKHGRIGDQLSKSETVAPVSSQALLRRGFYLGREEPEIGADAKHAGDMVFGPRTTLSVPKNTEM